MKNNLHFFKISQENPEPYLDIFYMFQERHQDILKYVESTKTIKNYLITIKTLEDKNEKKGNYR